MTNFYVSHIDNNPSEMRNLVLGMGYKTSQAPSPDYSDCGYKLTDGRYGTKDISDAAWVGHEKGMTRAIVFDLGDHKSIARIKANFLEDSKAAVEFPHTVSFYTSADGEKWSIVSHLGSQHEPWSLQPARIEAYVWDGAKDGVAGHPGADAVYAKYVKITFKMDLFVLIDEIEVWGTDEKGEKAVQLEPSRYAYLQAGKDTSGIKDLVLLYNGWYEQDRGNWKKEDIIPYISYVDEEGTPQDWLFDGVLYLGLRTPEQRDFHNPVIPTVMSDWQWYLDKTFAKNGDMSALNEAAQEVGEKLNQPGHKVKVVLMIPYASQHQSDFGDVDGDGISENFKCSDVGVDTAFANRKKAVLWYIGAVLEKWRKANFLHLELTGLYWVSEGLSYNVPKEKEFLQYTSQLVHKHHLKFFWIPYFLGNRDFSWKELGFDAAVTQPNHFFNETDVTRIQDTADLAQKYGMGVEIELDERINSKDPVFFQKYLDYLNGGVDFGYMKDSFKGYYQGSRALLEAALSKDPEIRKNYDIMYRFVKGTYNK